jgi:hypothetical protein
MRGYHWGFLAVVLLLGYLLGVWMPGPGRKVYSAIGVQAG